MARKKTTAKRKTASSPKSRKGKSSARKSPKKKDILRGPNIPLSDEDTLPTGTDPFVGNGLESPDCIPIAVKKKTSAVEIITLDNDETIVTPESNFVEMTFTVEDPKNDEHVTPSVSPGKHCVNFTSGLQKITNSLKNQKLVSEPEFKETFEMTISIEDIKKEPVDYGSDSFCDENSISQDSVKDWSSGKLFSADQIKKEIFDEDDVPLSALCSVGKNFKCVEESKIGHTGKKSTDAEGTLSTRCPVVIPSIKTEKIDLSDNLAVVNETSTAKPATKKFNNRSKKSNASDTKKRNVSNAKKCSVSDAKKCNTSDAKKCNATTAAKKCNTSDAKKYNTSDGKKCNTNDAKNCNNSDVKNCNNSDAKNCNNSDAKNCNISDEKKYSATGIKSYNGSDAKSCNSVSDTESSVSNTKSCVVSGTKSSVSDRKVSVSDRKSCVIAAKACNASAAKNCNATDKITCNVDDAKTCYVSDSEKVEIPKKAECTVNSGNCGINRNLIVNEEVYDNSTTHFVPSHKLSVNSEADVFKVDKTVPNLNVKIKEEPLSDPEDNGADTISNQAPANICKTISDKNLKQCVSSFPDVTILSVKIKQEPLSDSEDITDTTDISCASNGLQSIKETSKVSKLPEAIIEKVINSSNSKTCVSNAYDKGSPCNSPCVKETASTLTSGINSAPLEVKNLIVTSASDEFRKAKVNSAVNVTSESCGTEVAVRQATNSDTELLSKELTANKTASLNFGTLEKLNPTERVAVEVISSLPAEKLQELIRGIAEARKLDLKPVLEENIAKPETSKFPEGKATTSAKQEEHENLENSTQPVSKQNCAQQASECVRIKLEKPEMENSEACQKSSSTTKVEDLNSKCLSNSMLLQNTIAAEDIKTCPSSFVTDKKLSADSSGATKEDNQTSSDQVVSKQDLCPGYLTSTSEQKVAFEPCSDANNVLPHDETSELNQGLTASMKKEGASLYGNPQSGKVALPCSSESKGMNAAVDLNNVVSAENLQNILKAASGLEKKFSTEASMSSEVFSKLHVNSVNTSSSRGAFSPFSTDFLRTVIKTVEASSKQEEQPERAVASIGNLENVLPFPRGHSTSRTETNNSNVDSSEPLNKQESACLEVAIKHESKNDGTTERASKAVDNCSAIKTEKNEIVYQSPNAKKCKVENLEDDYSQVSMDCSLPSENDGDNIENRANKKRIRKRSRSRKHKKWKKDTAHDHGPKQSKEVDETLDDKDNLDLLRDGDQNSNSVKDEKILHSKMLDIPLEKNISKPQTNSVRKKLNDSIVEVIKLSGKGQSAPSKGKGNSSRELDQSKLKRKIPSPKRKSVDKESSLFDVENDPDVVSSKTSNKVQRFASRNAFLAQEMQPDKSFTGYQKQNKYKWYKGKKAESANFQEGHLLVKSPEIDDIHFGDNTNKIEVLVRGGHSNTPLSLDPRLNRANSFPGKHAKLNIEEYKEKYRNTMFSGSEFQQIHQLPVSSNNFNQPHQTVFQTNSYWNPSGNANPPPASVELTETLRNPVFSTFQQSAATQASFFANNSPPVLQSSQQFVPNQARFNLPMQSLLSPQNLPNITSNIPVTPAQNLLNINRNAVQPPSQNLPGVTRNVPVQPVRPLQNLACLTQKVPPPVQNLPNMTQSVPSVSPFSSTIPPLTFPPPPIRKHLTQQYSSLSSVSSPPPADSSYSSRFQVSSFRGCFPSVEASIPMQSFAPPLPSQPPPKIDVPPPPPLPPPDFFPPPPPASPPPDLSPTKSMSLASSSPSLSPPASSPPLFETSPSKPLQSDYTSSIASKNSMPVNFISSPPHSTYPLEQHLIRTPSSTPEQLCSRTSSSTPEQLFACPPSSETTDSLTRGSTTFPKGSTVETNSVSARRPNSVDSQLQGRTQSSNSKFSSKSPFTFKDLTKANSSSKDLLFLILSWSVSWLPQQIQISDPPPITEKVRGTESSYGCYIDYLDTYLPLLLLETWETIFLAWRQAKVIHYHCNVKHHKPEGRMLEIQCDTIISSFSATDGRYPTEGYLIIIKFGLLGGMGSTKMYGYVSHHSVRPFVIKSDFSNPCLKYFHHQPGEEVSVLSMTIKTAWKCDKIDFTVLPRIQVVHSLKPVLKQYDALLNLRISPLCKGILSPDSSLCKVVSLSKTHSSKQKSSSTVEIVEEIASLIVKPHPVPQIIVIEALPGTDKINTLVKLIQHIKSLEHAQKKTQLLLCSRTNEVVDEVGCHLILSQEEVDEKNKKVRCIRLGKLSDIHPEMRKFSFEDLVTKEVIRAKHQEMELPEDEYKEAAQKYAKTEIDHKTLLKLSLAFAEKLEKQLIVERKVLLKKQEQKENIATKHKMFHKQYVKEAQSIIIKTSDVILSTVANCHQIEVDDVCGKNSPTPLDCCIIDDASQCTELETLLPLLYGISKLVLLGDPNISPRVLSKTASSCNFDLSYYQRVFNQVQIR